jgi:RNA recognition motif-containing protein
MSSFRIYGKDLHEVPKEKLYSYFQQFGHLSDHIVRSKGVLKCQGKFEGESDTLIGFTISFRGLLRPEEELLNLVHYIEGVEVTCAKAAAVNCVSDRKVFVKYLDKKATAEDVEKSLSLFGPVESVNLLMKKNRSTNLGLCNVLFVHPESVSCILQEPSVFVKGKKVKVDQFESPSTAEKPAPVSHEDKCCDQKPIASISTNVNTTAELPNANRGDSLQKPASKIPHNSQKKGTDLYKTPKSVNNLYEIKEEEPAADENLKLNSLTIQAISEKRTAKEKLFQTHQFSNISLLDRESHHRSQQQVRPHLNKAKAQGAPIRPENTQPYRHLDYYSSIEDCFRQSKQRKLIEKHMDGDISLHENRPTSKKYFQHHFHSSAVLDELHVGSEIRINNLRLPQTAAPNPHRAISEQRPRVRDATAHIPSFDSTCHFRTSSQYLFR